MTIAAYWAWSCWNARTGWFHSAQEAGGIGWAYGAGLGGAVGLGRRVLAVSSDGGAMYSIGELAVARQHNLPVTWLIIDDGGYGILREYMTDAFGSATATELARPDYICPRRCLLGARAYRDTGEVGGGARGVVARGRSQRCRAANAARDVRADAPVLSFSRASRCSPRRGSGGGPAADHRRELGPPAPYAEAGHPAARASDRKASEVDLSFGCGAAMGSSGRRRDPWFAASLPARAFPGPGSPRGACPGRVRTHD